MKHLVAWSFLSSVLAALVLLSACASPRATRRPTIPTREPGITFSQKGLASWYGPGFRGRRTASGVRFNPRALTAAHRSLPFGTRVQVTNVHTGAQVEVTINDRGPFVRCRVIDVSQAAAQRLGLISAGTAPVTLTVRR